MDPSTPGRWQRRTLPCRFVGENVVVARPKDGQPVVLNDTAAAIWLGLAEATSLDELATAIGVRYASVDSEEVGSAVLEMESEGLVERTGT